MMRDTTTNFSQIIRTRIRRASVESWMNADLLFALSGETRTNKQTLSTSVQVEYLGRRDQVGRLQRQPLQTKNADHWIASTHCCN
ncbi:unnamed protein product [Gongylonema pulchrum]|uniref:Transposase n=1 Tax=Gongylonema pulchrum TaxID=637853 RepID=A0A183EBX2_9BILA|nr:unnamed protein product [Gongylonema pulchrum]